MLKIILKKSLDIFLPPRCILCNCITDEAGALCSKCWKEMDWVADPCCDKCGFPFEYEFEFAEESFCGACTEKPPIYDMARTVLIYNKQIGRMISGFKYYDKTYYAKSFAKWMGNNAGELIAQTDIITPVALHRRKLFQRRYNQSAILANLIAKNNQLDNAPDLLLRIKNVAPQVSLSKKQRLKNVSGIFAINPKYRDKIKGKNILLIDDVITTGATVRECTKILKKHGAAKVFILTLAKTLER